MKVSGVKMNQANASSGRLPVAPDPALHVPYSRLSERTKGERGVSAEPALRLECYFGSEAKGWLNLQSAYVLRIAETTAGKSIAKEIQPLALVV